LLGDLLRVGSPYQGFVFQEPVAFFAERLCLTHAAPIPSMWPLFQACKSDTTTLYAMNVTCRTSNGTLSSGDASTLLSYTCFATFGRHVAMVFNAPTLSWASACWNFHWVKMSSTARSALCHEVSPAPLVVLSASASTPSPPAASAFIFRRYCFLQFSFLFHICLGHVANQCAPRLHQTDDVIQVFCGITRGITGTRVFSTIFSAGGIHMENCHT